jgi:hypothetical protein
LEIEVMRCSRCQETIGVYEPVRLLRPDGSERRGSVLTLAEDIRIAGGVIMHERCEARDRDPKLP